ncbi:MAG: hypothetical protein VYC81_07520, partial [Actinomycetota bacterium]|nr:hypothetical protein [Actinomycetota bacterium]
MDTQVDDLWTIANVLGSVVVVAVAALLTLLVIFVHRIHKRVAAIKETLTATKANTADTELITTTAGGVEAVLAE